MLNYQRVLSFQLMLFAESTTLASKEFGDMLDMRRTTVARGVKVLYGGGPWQPTMVYLKSPIYTWETIAGDMVRLDLQISILLMKQETTC